MCSARTGARPSQAVRLLIRDLITVDLGDTALADATIEAKAAPGIRRSAQDRSVTGVDHAGTGSVLLQAAAKGRPSNAPLLLRRDGKPYKERPCS